MGLIKLRDASLGGLHITLSHLTSEFLDLAETLADCDPCEPEALPVIQELLHHSAAAERDKAMATAAIMGEFEA